MGDRYTKVVLTVIAIALVWLCLWGPGPHLWGTPAGAADFASQMQEAQRKAAELQILENDAALRAAAQRAREREAQINAQRNAADLARQSQTPGTAQNETGVVRVNIVSIGGRPIQVDWSTRFDGLSAVYGLPVQVKSAGH
jgi:hypothetical protein